MKLNKILIALAVAGLLFSSTGAARAWDGVTTAVSTSAQTAQVSVTQAAGIVAAGGLNRFSLTIRNTGLVTCWIGMTGVTTTTGFPLLAGDTMTVDRAADATWYAITATGTTTTVAILGE
jgi:hypothetical protein